MNHSPSLSAILHLQAIINPLCAPPPPPPLSAGGGAKPSTKFSKRGGLKGPQLLEGVCWKSGGEGGQGETFFRGGCNFCETKPEIFNHKKVYKQKYFSLT